jgi:hypothetical protein
MIETFERTASSWRAVLLIVLPVTLSVAALATAASANAAPCPNEAVRVELGSVLPDCRAYELVTPPDANGRSVEGVSNFRFQSSGALFPTELVSPAADRVAFMTFNGPVGEAGGLTGTLDLTGAERGSGGWGINRRFSPGGEEAVLPLSGGISSDHLYAFTDVNVVNGNLPGGTLAAAGDAQYLSNPDGSFELLGTGTVGGATTTERLAQGRYISEGGKHIIFSTGRLKSGSFRCFESSKGGGCPVHRLADNAPPEGTGAVYDRAADGPTKVVSLLPGDAIPGPGEDAAYQGVSKDGATVAFKLGATLYVRVPDAGDGETLKVAEGDPIYAGLSDDGRFLFYVAGGENGIINRFDTSLGTDDEVNPSAPGEIVNVSSDGSHVYFISESQIDGEGKAGQPNLYVWSGGTPGYLTTVAPSDLIKTSNFGADEADFANGIPALTNWTDWAVTPDRSESKEQGPGADSSRSTPDGNVLIFESRAKLTSYKNDGHTEIYRWDDEEKDLDCVSCNLTAGDASQDARLQLMTLLPPPNVIHNLSADGQRVFFETPEPLVPEDFDGVNDIYEWQAGDSGGFFLHLISSGRSQPEIPTLLPLERLSVAYQPRPNVIFGITPSGGDVVFLSQDELVPGAGGGGSPNLYDARIDGGFPLSHPASPCSEEACRPGPGASEPILEAPRSQNVRGSGNVRKHRKHRCHRRHSKNQKQRSRCVKPKSKDAKFSKAVVDSVTATVAPEQGGSGTSGTNDVALRPNDGAFSSVAPGGGEFEEFSIEAVGAEATTTAAGGHPNLETYLSLNHFVQGNGLFGATARTEDIVVKLPPGLTGNPNTVAKCTTAEFLAYARCPTASQVGIAKALLFGFEDEFVYPIYNLQPPHPDREVARFGFYPTIPVFIDVRVRTADDYGVTAVVHHAPGQTSLLAAETVFWGDPTNPVHDEERLTSAEAPNCPGTACEEEDGKREVPRNGLAFMSNPSACQDGSIDFDVTSYQRPGEHFSASAPLKPITDCQGLPFEPSFDAEPTSHMAGGATGLKTRLVLPQHPGAQERATATMREARVTLPAGMQIAAGAANWIGTCSDEQVGLHEEVDAACPNNSKLGAATITSPALPEPLEGNLYQRTPSPGHQFGLWLVADDLGLHVKVPGELVPDSGTGRLTAVFTDLPQVPVEEIDFHVWGGDRAPLQNPDRCGTYTTNYSFSPHSNDPAVSGQSQLTIDAGCGQGFDPKLEAGVTGPVAGKFSPLIVDLTKGDGQQNLRGFTLTLPDGELAKLKGVPLCPDAAAVSGACPADSAIGHLTAASGPGTEPLWVPQPGKLTPRLFLAGPYQESPFSIVAVVPAQAGPFDLGSVVVRSGLGLDPDSNRAVVKADSLPQFFEGVGLTYRRLHVVVDRPGFSLNPTDCRAMRTNSTVTSTQDAVAHPASSFQVHGCKRLKFKPMLSLKLKGGTKRGQYPALTAILKARKGDANIGKVSVALPHSEFLAQEHIGTICTRKQFAADRCPTRSVYGTAKAFTPLLAKPLEGPVYLRSSDHPLPDLVAALGGELDVNLAGRIDSVSGGIRTTFEAVPDAPVTKFVLRMRGRAKSLLVNSTDTCLRGHRAQIAVRAQNGRALSFGSPLRSGGCGSRHG